MLHDMSGNAAKEDLARVELSSMLRNLVFHPESLLLMLSTKIWKSL